MRALVGGLFFFFWEVWEKKWNKWGLGFCLRFKRATGILGGRGDGFRFYVGRADILGGRPFKLFKGAFPTKTPFVYSARQGKRGGKRPHRNWGGTRGNLRRGHVGKFFFSGGSFGTKGGSSGRGAEKVFGGEGGRGGGENGFFGGNLFLNFFRCDKKFFKIKGIYRKKKAVDFLGEEAYIDFFNNLRKEPFPTQAFFPFLWQGV